MVSAHSSFPAAAGFDATSNAHNAGRSRGLKSSKVKALRQQILGQGGIKAYNAFNAINAHNAINALHFSGEVLVVGHDRQR